MEQSVLPVVQELERVLHQVKTYNEQRTVATRGGAAFRTKEEALLMDL
jgi:hypothetical protein